MNTELLKPNSAGIERAAELLSQGLTVAIPTETVYGLAANALDPRAVSRVFEAKERPSFDPLIVHILDQATSSGQRPSLPHVDFTRLSTEQKTHITQLSKAFWPGPLTLVLPKLPEIHDLVTSGLPSVGIRIPKHPLAQALLKTCGFPLAAPSANRFGRISPTTAQAVYDELNGKFAAILDGGSCEVGLESTVLSILPESPITLLRPGGVTQESIETLLGQKIMSPTTRSLPANTPLTSPGMSDSHYAPIKPLNRLPASIDSISDIELCKVLGKSPVTVLLIKGDRTSALARLRTLIHPDCIALVLSPGGDPAEAARHLFQKLREADAQTPAVIWTEPCPWNGGIGFAIQDRLTRASTPWIKPRA